MIAATGNGVAVVGGFVSKEHPTFNCTLTGVVYKRVNERGKEM
jgi:hypothetical protein